MVDHESKSTTAAQMFEVVDKPVIPFMASMAEVDCKSIVADSHFVSSFNPAQSKNRIANPKIRPNEIGRIFVSCETRLTWLRRLCRSSSFDGAILVHECASSTKDFSDSS
jgi:hypothetical protein